MSCEFFLKLFLRLAIDTQTLKTLNNILGKNLKTRKNQDKVYAG